MKKFPSIKSVQILNKSVFLRADLDVPLSQQATIIDSIRLNAWLPTLKYLLNSRAKVIIAGHLGRPQKKFSISNFQLSNTEREFSLAPVAKWIEKETGLKSHEAELGGFPGWKYADNLFLLENLRFYKEEEENNPEFAKRLASLADIYVNDAFAVSHRYNASVSEIAKYLPHFAGFRLEEEVTALSKVLDEPKRPLVVIVGGIKIETKLPLIQKMSEIADHVLVGGKLAAETEALSKVGESAVIAKLTEDGLDVTEESLRKFLEVVKTAKTIIWNGPLHKIPNTKYQISNSSSSELAQAIIGSGAYSVVGGGDTIAFLDKEKLLDKFSFYSIGGGAMLAFLSGEKLPGLEALIRG
ncbi:MAG: phosphoglycerate kinase [Candidatus Levybacteria bacterium]|nr:phosphoglycerate kinase [Candidatus Levybacteria bacterium]